MSNFDKQMERTCRRSGRFHSSALSKLNFIPADYEKAGFQPPEDNDGFYLVEKIVGHRLGKNNKHEYKVRWLGWDARWDTWEPETNFNPYFLECARNRYILHEKNCNPKRTQEQYEVIRAHFEYTKSIANNQTFHNEAIAFQVDPELGSDDEIDPTYERDEEWTPHCRKKKKNKKKKSKRSTTKAMQKRATKLMEKTKSYLYPEYCELLDNNLLSIPDFESICGNVVDEIIQSKDTKEYDPDDPNGVQDPRRVGRDHFRRPHYFNCKNLRHPQDTDDEEEEEDSQDSDSSEDKESEDDESSDSESEFESEQSFQSTPQPSIYDSTFRSKTTFGSQTLVPCETTLFSSKLFAIVCEEDEELMSDPEDDSKTIVPLQSNPESCLIANNGTEALTNSNLKASHQSCMVSDSSIASSTESCIFTNPLRPIGTVPKAIAALISDGSISSSETRGVCTIDPSTPLGSKRQLDIPIPTFVTPTAYFAEERSKKQRVSAVSKLLESRQKFQRFLKS